LKRLKCSTNRFPKLLEKLVRLRHVGIACEDLEASIYFWSHVLGFEIFWDELEPEPYISRLLGFTVHGVRTVKLRSLNGDVVELLYFLKRREDDLDPTRNLHTAIGITHFAFTTPDIRAMVERLEAAGFKSISEPLQPPGGSVLVSYFMAPDNVMIELVEDAKSTGSRA